MRRTALLCVLVVGAAVLMHGDGRGLSEYRERFDWTATEIIIWQQLWSPKSGRVRAVLSEPASGRIAQRYAGVVDRARNLGFRFRLPTLRQTTKNAAVMFADDPIYGEYFPGPNSILIASQHADAFDDELLDVLLAHELGHAIDMQNERMGHPILDHFSSDEDYETVAHQISGHLCGFDAMIRLRRRLDQWP